MTPEQTRAHNTLMGQTLLAEWRRRCRAIIDCRTGYSNATSLIGQARIKRMCEIDDQWLTANDTWRAAVRKEFGPGCGIAWSDDGDCRLGCGEVYSHDIFSGRRTA